MSQQPITYAHLTIDQIWAKPKTDEEARSGYMLVEIDTGKEINLFSPRRCPDGTTIAVRNFKPSRYQGNEGYIYTTMNETLRPSVIGAKIVAVKL